MIWSDKYRPDTFEELGEHSKVGTLLKCYTINSLPHLIIHGDCGHGKKTILHCLITHLYGKKPVPRLKEIQLETASGKVIDVSYVESDEYIEVSPSEYGYQDKLVIQTLIKQLAQTKPILSFLNQKKENFLKLIVISNAESLSKDAQAALRRTVETYSVNFRIVLMCNELLNIIEPLRSRCLTFRIPGFSNEYIKTRLEFILKKEDVYIDNEIIDEVVGKSRGNMRMAISLIECYSMSLNDKSGNKRQKSVNPTLDLEWEKSIKNIALTMKREQNASTLIKIRTELYDVLNSCIPPKYIIIRLLIEILSFVNKEEYFNICDSAALYNERLVLGSKSIFHLEGFVASCLYVLSKR
ncbi:small subunit of DNA replication factor C [Hamiltosporidium magnivora]|uniref:Small subunit of DNA replication factor C n=1 Tax=Hamiltosporidium magnivora TaxID=148818 RepID=A0A4Q9LPF7_9MICR|nr:small subunit of DNA replication factor C [Hamiltosporidium magnivora]TBU09401.1 small subunit of DNA replication factor C [Hamiltosporidium magnivora]